MDRRRITSGSPWEEILGCSRAVVAGPHVFVTATAATMPDGADPPADTYAQSRRALEIILAALAEAGARAEHVVRTRIYLTPSADPAEAVRAHGDLLGDPPRERGHRRPRLRRSRRARRDRSARAPRLASSEGRRPLPPSTKAPSRGGRCCGRGELVPSPSDEVRPSRA